MNYIMTLVFLALCSFSNAYEALSAALQRRRDSHPVYARHYADEYEPYAFAAIPLHAPVPIVHLLSQQPIHKYIQKRRQPLDSDHQAYGSMHTDDYEPYEYNSSYSPNSQKYSVPMENDEQTVVIYARPNKNGGYTYRKRPSNSTPRPKREPVIFRIHKYKITKE